MSDSNIIQEFLDGMRPRVHTLQTEHAGANGAEDGPSMLDRALDELRTSMEELQVSEEELRVQAETMAEQQSVIEREMVRYRDLFRLSPEPRLVTDTDGLITEGNDAAARLLRPGAMGLPGRPLSIYVAEDDRRPFRALLRRLAHGEVVEDTLHLSPRGSLPVEVEVSATARARSPGAPLELHWTLRDVTARHNADADTTQAAALRSAGLECAPVALVAMDVDGSVLFSNAAARALLGWTEEQVQGRRNPALSPEEVARSREAAQNARGGARFTLAHRADGGMVPVWVSDAPLVDIDGRVCGLVTSFRQPDGDEDRAQAPAPAAASEPARGAWTREESLQILRCAAGSDAGDVVSRLRNWIASGLHLGYLHGDDRLPSIREVSQECAVDHRAVSAAYRALAADGVVEVRSRHGVYVAPRHGDHESGLSETADWLAGVLGEACALQLKVPMLPDLVRDWTQGARVVCACVDDTEDGLVALTTELRQQWGLETVPVPLAAAPGGRPDEAALVAELRKADLVVTTSFHAGPVGQVAASLGKTMVVLRAHPEMVQTLEERMAAAPVTAIVADAEYGERLRCVRGAAEPGRLRVVAVSDGPALDALDPAEPVLMTRAAQQRLGGVRGRLLYPLSPMFCPSASRDLAEVLIGTNVRAGRRGG